MALAILEAGSLDESGMELFIDTGTSAYHQVRVGRSVRQVEGVDVVDDVVFATPVSKNPHAGDHLGPRLRVVLPTDRFAGQRVHAQLVTYRSAAGRSPAFSAVVPVTAVGPFPPPMPARSLMASAMSTPPTAAGPTRPPVRRVACRTGDEVFAHQASIGDLLGQLADLAGPVLTQLLAAPPSAGQAAATGSAGAAGAPAPAGNASTLAALIQAVLAALATGGTSVAGAPASVGQSVPGRRVVAGSAEHDGGGEAVGLPANRFATPFIAGIDDALLGMLVSSIAGPLIEVFPQLANLLNQRRLGITQANNQHTATLLTDLNRRLLLERLAQARPAGTGPNGGSTATGGLDQLEALLRAAAPPPGSPPPAPTPPPTAQASSLTGSGEPRAAARAVLEMETGPPLVWNGAPTVLFSKRHGVKVRVRLRVAPPVPTTPLPRAILRLVVKDEHTQEVLAEQSTRLRDVLPERTITAELDGLHTARIPMGRPVSLVAELRWPTRSGAVVAALGSLRAVFVGERFLKAEGPSVGPDRDLLDMSRFRSFWNKVWESPTGGHGRKLWDLDVAVKYTVLVAPDQDANGFMQPRLQRTEPPGEGVTERVAGRLKAGMEVTVPALADLRSLWPEEAPLPADALEALRTERFARDHTGEVVTSLRLRGRMRERGVVWAVPRVRLTAFTLSKVSAVDDHGQVAEVVDEVVRFPVPAAVRFFGLLGTEDAGASAGDEQADEEATDVDGDGEPPLDASSAADAGFSFQGYETVLSRTVALTPLPAPAGTSPTSTTPSYDPPTSPRRPVAANGRR